MNFITVILVAVLPLVVLRITKKLLNAAGFKDLGKGGMAGIKGSMGSISAMASKAAGEKGNPVESVLNAPGKKLSATKKKAVDGADKLSKFSKARKSAYLIKNTPNGAGLTDANLENLGGFGTLGKLKGKLYKADMYRRQLNTARNNKSKPLGESVRDKKADDKVTALLASNRSAKQPKEVDGADLEAAAALRMDLPAPLAPPGTSFPVQPVLGSSAADALAGVNHTMDTARAVHSSTPEAAHATVVAHRQATLEGLRVAAGLDAGVMPVLSDEQLRDMRTTTAQLMGVTEDALLYHPLTGTFVPDPTKAPGGAINHPVFKLDEEVAVRAMIVEGGATRLENDAEFADRLYSVLDAMGAIDVTGHVVSWPVFAEAYNGSAATQNTELAAALIAAGQRDMAMLSPVVVRREVQVQAEEAVVEAAKTAGEAEVALTARLENFALEFSEETIWKSFKYGFNDAKFLESASQKWIDSISDALQASMESTTIAGVAARVNAPQEELTRVAADWAKWQEEVRKKLATSETMLCDMLKNASSVDELQSVYDSMQDILGPITAEVRSAARAVDYDKLVALMRSQAMLVAGDTRYVDPVHVLRPTSLLGAAARKELPG